MDACLDVLRWVTGGPAPELDDERLLRTIGDHGLANRAACRLAGDRPGWASPALVEAVTELAEAARQRVRRQVALVAELAAMCPSPRDLVPIKGFGPHLLTGDDCAIRHSVDVDLLAADPDAAAAVLSRAGFTSGAKAPSAHELWNVVRDGWKVELHRHLPCWSYAAQRPSVDLDPRRHPETWVQADAIVRRGIGHGDVIGASVEVRAAGGRLSVPDARAALVVTCAHAFRDFMSLATLYNRHRPRVRLAAVAEMLALSRHPRFRPTAFLELARRLGAHDAVEWARELIEQSLGESPWPATPPTRADAASHVARYPRHVWGDFLAEIDLPLTDAYAAGLPIATVVTQLGCSEVRPGAEYRVGGTGDRRLRRVLVEGEERTGLRLRLDVRGGLLHVHLEVRRDPSAAPGTERVRLELGTHAVEWDHDVPAATVTVREVTASGSVRSATPAVAAGGFALPGRVAAGAVGLDERGRVADLALPLGELRPVRGEAGPALPVVVGIGRLADGGAMAAGLLVPMMVGL